jgi:hypothetical protein
VSVGRTQAKGSVLAVVCAAALVGAAMSTAAAPKKPALAAPVNCGKLIPVSLAERLTALGITSVTASTKKVKDGWVSSCRYHSATDAGSSPAISLVIYPMTAAKRTAFMKGLVSAAARATSAALAPQCQPGYTVPEGAPPIKPSDCVVLHPFGPASFEFGSSGLVYATAKYYVDDLSVHGDEAQEALMREVIAKLR